MKHEEGASPLYVPVNVFPLELLEGTVPVRLQVTVLHIFFHCFYNIVTYQNGTLINCFLLFFVHRQILVAYALDEKQQIL